MLESKEVADERRKDAERKKNFNAKLEALRDAATTAASRRYESLSQQLKALLDKKTELQKAPQTREEVLELAKGALRKAQSESSLENILSKHFQTCMERKNVPLNPDFLKTQFFTPAETYRIIYWILTAGTLEKAAASLPSGGLGKKEREAQIMAIDTEIFALEGQLEKMAGEEEK